MKLERAVHHRGVLITIAFIEQPREIGVQTFVMAHDARSEVVEAT